MKYVDTARSPGSAIRVITSSERLASQLKINEIDDPKVGKIEDVEKLVRKIETGDPRNRKLVKKNEMDVPKVEQIGWKLGEEDRDGWSTSKNNNEAG